MRPGPVILGLWFAWLISWLLAAFWSDRTQAHPPIAEMIRYRVPMLAGTVLMFVPAHNVEGPLRLWHVGWLPAWTCVAVVAVGIAIAWWARLYLGRLWSGRITRKADHHVVDTGPYGMVRHPIYFGLLLSLLATALAKGTVLGLAAFALLLLGLWIKARQEERWLRQELGADLYADYCKRVPMLLPFGPTDR
jgi:protein-S-isoprenylcysteine O-methyltransferase Ste14